MINTINVILSNHSVPFCHYTVNEYGEEKWIDKNDLKKCFDYSTKNNLSVNVVFPKSTIPNDINEILVNKKYGTTKDYDFSTPADINIIKISDIQNINFCNSENLIFVVLFTKDEISMLSYSLKKLQGQFKRISFVITDIELWDTLDINNYKEELDKNFDLLIDIYKNSKESLPEINFITDRWFLKSENSCNAGINHYTLAPDGYVYLCPAFYFNSKENIGKLNDIKIINEQLLNYDYAPICKRCDAYHCNRCIYLNKIMTNEFNIPSYQQCVISHIEREFSRKLLCELKSLNSLFNQIKKIPEIDYFDPLEKKLRK